MAEKKRLDVLLVEKGLASSRQRARALIMAGCVLVDTLLVDKPGTLLTSTQRISLKKTEPEYVSRGGLKLKAALDAWNIAVNGLVCLDVGASTGGFTDCLLQYGAGHVYAVDVGYGQLSWKLRQDPRVTPIERTNIRYMPIDQIPAKIDLATIDTSFISLKIVVPAVKKFLKPQALLLALIKPQFEVGKGRVGKGGVVRDPVLQKEIIADLVAFFKTHGLACGPHIPSPIRGPKGNQEYIIHLTT